MSFIPDNAVIWPVPPNWENGIKETLTWLTDVMQSPATGSSQHRQLRLAPRRSLSFDVLANAQARRLADLLLADRSSRAWQVPIWLDVQVLQVPLTAGVTGIPCRTDGFDFVAGEKALLWVGLNTWSLVTIAAIVPTGLALDAGLDLDYPAGSRLYPVRTARVSESPEETLLTDDLGQRSVTFDIAEPCDWLAADFLPVYRDWPVLEWRPDEGESPRHSSKRLITVVDNETGLPSLVDLAGIALRSQSFRWLIHGREEQSHWRGVLYLLCGRALPVWLPSFAADLNVVADIAAADTTLTIEWAGYTLYGRQQSGCRHIRIEAGARVFYRRILASSDHGETETLTLDTALGFAVSSQSIRQVNYLRLCTLASDTVEIQHETDADGLALCDLTFAEVTE